MSQTITTFQFPAKIDEHDKYFIYLEVYRINPINVNILERSRAAGDALSFVSNISRDVRRIYNYESRTSDLLEVFKMPLQQSITETVTTSFETVNTRKIERTTGIVDDVLGGDVRSAVSSGFEGFTEERPLAGVLNTARGRAINPNEQLDFKGVDRREWPFEINMLSRSLEDARNLQDIRKRLQFHALPGLQGGRLFFSIPHIFRFKFVKYNHGDRSIKDIENLFYSKFCFMTSLTIQSGSESYDEFTDGNLSYPGSMKVSMTLKETELITKRDYSENSFYLNGWRPR